MYSCEKSNKCSVITHPPYMHRCKRLEDTFEEEKTMEKVKHLSCKFCMWRKNDKYHEKQEIATTSIHFATAQHGGEEPAHVSELSPIFLSSLAGSGSNPEGTGLSGPFLLDPPISLGPANFNQF